METQSQTHSPLLGRGPKSKSLLGFGSGHNIKGGNIGLKTDAVESKGTVKTEEVGL